MNAPSNEAEREQPGGRRPIVKPLCDFLEASLELPTKAGQGCTFRVILPRNEDQSW